MRNRRAVRIATLFGTLVIATTFLYGLHSYIFTDQEGYERQEEEESIAEQFLEEQVKRYITHLGSLTVQEQDEPETVFEDPTEGVEDGNYYERDGVTYTPEYAVGKLDCILTVPTAGINRGVYIGDWDEIQHDLDIWMVTAARPDQILGETHYPIYGHNHTAQSLSFNNLKNVQLGDPITLTTEEYVYEYEVTDIFADWRPEVTRNVVDNFNLPADEVEIITCGRDENRYKDLVVVGTLTSKLTMEEYVKQQLGKVLLPYDIQYEQETDRISISQLLPDGSMNAGSSHEILDESGNVVKTFTLEDEAVEIKLPDGNYKIQTRKQPEGIFYGRSEAEFTVKNESVQEIIEIQKKEIETPDSGTSKPEDTSVILRKKQCMFRAVATGVYAAIIFGYAGVCLREKRKYHS